MGDTGGAVQPNTEELEENAPAPARPVGMDLLAWHQHDKEEATTGITTSKEEEEVVSLPYGA